MSNYDVDLDRNTRRKIYFGEPCKSFTKGEDCPECKAAQTFFRNANRENNPAEKGLLKEKGRLLMARSKIFVNGINLKDEEGTYPSRIYVLPPTVYDDIVNQAKGLRQLNSELNPFDPGNGCRIVVTRTGQGIQTRYRVQIDQTPQPLPRMEALEDMFNLDNIEMLITDQQSAFTIFENGPNILRILPPWDDRRVLYKEVKFHRFSIDYVLEKEKSEGGQAPAPSQSSIPNAPDPFKENEAAPAPDASLADTSDTVNNFFDGFESPAGNNINPPKETDIDDSNFSSHNVPDAVDTGDADGAVAELLSNAQKFADGA